MVRETRNFRLRKLSNTGREDSQWITHSARIESAVKCELLQTDLKSNLVCTSLVFVHPCGVVEENNWQVRDHRPFLLRVLHAKLNRLGDKLLPRRGRSAQRCTKCRTRERRPFQPQSTKVGRINGSCFTLLRTPHSSDLPGRHRKDPSACIPASWEAAGQAHGILESLS